MKITKKKLIEDIERAQDVLDELPAEPEDERPDLEDATQDEIKADMLQAAVEADPETVVDTQKLNSDAKKVWELADLIVNPYGTSNPGKIERVLQRSLRATLRDAGKPGASKEYQNVIISGLAGFGKTAIVEKFCRDHHLNMFECDAKNMAQETVGGIPYPQKDKNGEVLQSPIASRYWDNLSLPNTVLFLDELNRASLEVQGSLLTLINQHKLPITKQDPVTGKFQESKFYPNILFTIIAVNPASSIFPGVRPMDPAVRSRNTARVSQGPVTGEDQSEVISEFYTHISDFYNKLLSCKSIPDSDKREYAGQYNIAKTILLDPGFHFDEPETVQRIYQNQGEDMDNYLNYRTFLGVLLRCDGTKADYLSVLNDEASFTKDDIVMLKNILASYIDDPNLIGNTVFTKTGATAKQKMSSIEVKKALDTYLNSL